MRPGPIDLAKRWWRMRGKGRSTPDAPSEHITRMARQLLLRSRRETTSVFVGGYAAAFRGEGMEFEESRPYVPGEDVRAIDWHATARTGELWVKRYREERDRLLILALDISASMDFGSRGIRKSEMAARAAALLAVAAVRAGDRVALLTFSDRVHQFIPPGRGGTHLWRVILSASAGAHRPRGSTRLHQTCEAIRKLATSSAIVVMLSDFRWPVREDVAPSELEIGLEEARAFLAPLDFLSPRHDVLAVSCEDPAESNLSSLGPIRVKDIEGSHHAIRLDTRSSDVRQRYSLAAQTRIRILERNIRGQGSDFLRLHTHREPLAILARHFRLREGRIG